MGQLYIYGAITIGIAVVIGALFAAFKIQSARADKFKVEAQAAAETAKSAQIEIAQTNKTVEAVAVAEKETSAEHEALQTSLDAGDRSFMDKGTF